MCNTIILVEFITRLVEFYGCNSSSTYVYTYYNTRAPFLASLWRQSPTQNQAKKKLENDQPQALGFSRFQAEHSNISVFAGSPAFNMCDGPLHWNLLEWSGPFVSEQGGAGKSNQHLCGPHCNYYGVQFILRN